MRIGVVGGTFLDLYIYGEEAHSVEIIEDCGGSGLNVAFGLMNFGFEVLFFSNIGDDHRGQRILNQLRKEGFNLTYMSVVKGETGLHVAYNEKVIAVSRGVNRLPVSLDHQILETCDAIFVNTEVPVETIQDVLKNHRGKKIFLECGPRPILDNSIKDLYDVLAIGNERECQKISCDVVKMGPMGAKWGEIFVEADRQGYKYTIGCGDVFDVVLLVSLIYSKGKEEALKKAVFISQEMAKSIKGAFNKMKKLTSL